MNEENKQDESKLHASDEESFETEEAGNEEMKPETFTHDDGEVVESYDSTDQGNRNHNGESDKSKPYQEVEDKSLDEASPSENDGNQQTVDEWDKYLSKQEESLPPKVGNEYANTGSTDSKSAEPITFLDMVNDESEVEDGFPSFKTKIDSDMGMSKAYDREIDMMISSLGNLETMMGQINSGVELLQREFQGKLKYDNHKNKIIDNLHEELQQFKTDLIKKQVKTIVMDLIKMIDNIRRLTEHYRSQDPKDNNPEKLVRLLDSIPTEIEDIISLQGIKSFICGGVDFNPRRQRVLKKIETSDKKKDKTIAESIRPGYEWDGNVIRPEMVAVYIYQEAPMET